MRKCRENTIRRRWTVPRPEPAKALGCLVGLAVCEALARPDSGDISPQTPLTEGPWGDGTTMALSLAESLIEGGGIDQRDQMVRYTSWFRYGYLSSTETCDYIDEVVKQATLRFERTWNPEDESRTQGDVCLARVAPVVLFFSDSRESMLEACSSSTCTTHSGPQSLDACRLLAAMISEALDATDKSQVLRPALPLDLCPEVEELRSGISQTREFPACASLGAAMDAFRNSTSFADGCRLCLPHGPRAMAAYGQLAGAWYGLGDIPEAWRQSLARFDLLDRMGNLLLKD